MFIVGGTVIVVGFVTWNLWRVRKSLQVEISEELEKMPSLARTGGWCWLRKTGVVIGLQTKLQPVLQSVKRLCDAVWPPS